MDAELAVPRRDTVPFPAWELTDRARALYRNVGTDVTLISQAEGWERAAVHVQIEECRALLAATDAIERAAVRQVFAWLRQEYLTQH